MGIARVTMAGINAAYEKIYGDNIFEDIQVPEDIDNDIMINRIMYACGEFSVMHTDIDFMHAQILNFFKVHYRTFERWIAALNEEYDPLHNYDRTETYTGNGSHNNSSSQSGSDSNTITTTKAAFNSSGYEPYEKNASSGTSNGSGSDSGSFSEGHTLRAYGNIGVTTSQQMLESEWDVAKLNIYIAIADLFKDEFCIQVY